MGAIADVQNVPVFDVPTLLKTLCPPNVLKCDVEGAEIEVFGNANVLLSEIRPVIISEIGDETNLDMSVIFAHANYRMFKGEASLKGAEEIAEAAWSTVAIPAEKLREYTT